MRKFGVIIEKDEDGYFVATVPALPAFHTQAKSLNTLMKRVKKAIELCLEVEKTIFKIFIGVQKRRSTDDCISICYWVLINSCLA